MNTKRPKEKTLVYIQTSDYNARPGEVKLSGDAPNFRLRCTVHGRGWRREVKLYATAQAVAFAHAGPHRSV